MKTRKEKPVKIKTKSFDKVIKSYFLTGYTNYDYAIKYFYPLINRLNIQRKIQNTKFYKRLEEDLKEGCIMPPLTLAFIDNSNFSRKSMHDFQTYVNSNIRNCFVLDGIQRLNTLKRVFDKNELNLNRPIYLNIIICDSRDNLLYRMVTLNNGQKPMTARHQIEILASNIYDFKSLGIDILTEKETANKRSKTAFKTADIISAYIAFLSGTTILESSKIIEEKMDELIARQIIESDITRDQIEFVDVIAQIVRLCADEFLLSWFKNLNNLIGFCVGIKKSYRKIKKVSVDDFNLSVENFEEAFGNFDVSKIKLSRERRKLSQYFIENYEKLYDADSDELLLTFSELD